MGGCLPRDYGCAAVTHVRQNRIRAIPPASLNCSVAITGDRFIMAVKIKLTRLGKIRNPQYRIAVADARTRRDGRSIEVIGRYHPKEDPSLIEIDSERAQYWLGVGAQPTEPVLQLLKITGDWQKFKGLPGAEGTLKVKEPKPSKLDLFNAALAAAEGGPSTDATTPKKKKAPAKKAADKAAGDASDQAAVEAEATADPSGAKDASEPAAEGADATVDGATADGASGEPSSAES
jgi:small subunit ribosomal protein S16